MPRASIVSNNWTDSSLLCHWHSLQDIESVNRELLEVQRVNSQLRAEVDSLKEQAEEESEKHSLQLQKLRQEMRDMDSKHRRETTETETQYKVLNVTIYFAVCHLDQLLLLTV